MTKKKVGLALSGGIDSSVSALLLKEQGYDVACITAKMTADESFEEVAKNAALVANSLGLEHHVIDLEQEFKKEVIEYFETAYKNGFTPNPCIVCNKKIKWGKLFDYAKENLGAELIATGHYAQIQNKNGIFKLYPASDSKKDQLYYLFELSQEQLSKTIFPLSNLTKEEVRKIAAQNNLPSKSSKDSQDICFIKKPITTKTYLESRLEAKNGNFIHEKTGETLGTHTGFFKYTIGQRKGIGIAYKEPLYVTKIDAETNTVYLGSPEELLSSSLKINSPNIQDTDYEDKVSFEALVKIRYNTSAKPAKIQKSTQNTYKIDFDTPISAVAKGQAAVIYDLQDAHLIGGGWIE